MLGEVLAAAIIGIVALWLVLQPLVQRSAPRQLPIEPVDPEETPKGIALTALKEIEFDRETGKLSDADYEFLKAKYTSAALEVLRLDSAVKQGTVSDDVEAMIAAKVRALRSASAAAPSDSPARSAPVDQPHSLRSAQTCPTCGPRPEPDAAFCSTCGRRLPTQPACDRCGAALLPDSRFCEACGRRVAA